MKMERRTYQNARKQTHIDPIKMGQIPLIETPKPHTQNDDGDLEISLEILEKSKKNCTRHNGGNREINERNYRTNKKKRKHHEK